MYCVCSLEIKIKYSIEYITITESLKCGLCGYIRERTKKMEQNNIHTSFVIMIYDLFKNASSVFTYFTGRILHVPEYNYIIL